MSYATPDDFENLGLPLAGYQELTPELIQAQLDADAGIMDLYLGNQFTLPVIAPYPDALIRINVCLSSYSILCRRGFNPEGPDGVYQENYKRCIEMLEKIADGSLSVPGIEDSTPGTSDGAPTVATFQQRGWQTTWGEGF